MTAHDRGQFARTLRATVEAICTRQVGNADDPIVVATSGGIDGWATAIAMRSIGREVYATSFTFEDHESKDFKLARENAHRMRVPFLDVRLPRDPKRIVADLRYLLIEPMDRRKTTTECFWPFLYILDRMNLDDLHSLTTGLGAGAWFGDGRHNAINHKHELDVARQEWYDSKAVEGISQSEIGRYISERYGVRLIDVWHQHDLRPVFAGTTWQDINVPIMKQATHDAFPELAALITKPHVNLQGGDSYISERLGAAAMSIVPNARSPIAAYNAIARELGQR